MFDVVHVQVIDLFLQFSKFLSFRAFPENVIELHHRHHKKAMVIAHHPGIYLCWYSLHLNFYHLLSIQLSNSPSSVAADFVGYRGHFDTVYYPASGLISWHFLLLINAISTFFRLVLVSLRMNWSIYRSSPIHLTPLRHPLCSTGSVVY